MKQEVRFILVAVVLPALLLAGGGAWLIHSAYVQVTRENRLKPGPGAHRKPPPHLENGSFDPHFDPDGHRFGDFDHSPPPQDGMPDPRKDANARLNLLLGCCALTAAATTLLIVNGGAVLLQSRRERKLSQLKTDFIDNVSHELRTPLAGIRLNAELLAEGRIGDETRRHAALEAILIEADRLSNMVGNLLDFSRLEKGTRRYSIKTFDLAGFINAPSELQAIHAISNGRVRVDVKEPGAKVEADVDAIRQIGINLVANALKYSDGEIDLVVDGPRLVYKDRGPGIPHGDEERIFERFYRVDNSLTRRTGGSGLGLPIARALARGMGGDLTYAHREGGGSVFTLHLKEAT